jgi:hypothetical protein
LEGRIVDASHAGVVSATIRVRDAGTNEVRTVQSQFDGDYTISNLQPGAYEVNIEKAGFKQIHESSLELQVEQTARLDVQLEVGAVSQSVEVVAQVPLINTETSSRGDVIAPRDVTEMPLIGRDLNDLALMVPGGQPDQPHVTQHRRTVEACKRPSRAARARPTW